MPRRSRWTLIETLVALDALFWIAAAFLPSLQAARQAGLSWPAAVAVAVPLAAMLLGAGFGLLFTVASLSEWATRRRRERTRRQY